MKRQPNIQNIPIRTRQGQAIRKAFIPDDVGLTVDWTSVERALCSHPTTAIIRRKDGKFVECTEICKICGQVVRRWVEEAK